MEGIFAILTFVLRHLQGRHEELLEPVRAMAALNPGIPAMRAGLAVPYAETGRAADAQAQAAPLIGGIDEIPPDVGLVPMPALAHVCALTADVERAALVHDRLRIG